MAKKKTTTSKADKLTEKSYSSKMKEQIDFGFAYQKGTNWLKDSNRLLGEFKGTYYKSKSTLERYVVNTIFSLVNLILPNLIFSTPYIKVKAKTPTFEKKNMDGSFTEIDNIESAAIMEAAINHVMKEIDAWDNIQMAIQDTLYYSVGYTKVGYSVETESIDDMDYVKEENPFVMRVGPKDIGYHPLGTNTNNTATMIHHMVRHKDDLEANKNYSNVSELKPSLPEELSDKISNIKKGNPVSDFFRVWEVHDQKKGKIITFGGENKLKMWERDKEYDFEGSDFCMLKFAGDNDEFLGIPLLGMIEDQAIALNDLLTYMMRHVRMFPGVVDAETGSMDDDDIERMKNTEQGSVHMWDSINAIKRTPPLPMGSDYFNLVNLLFNIIDRILGVPDFQRGMSKTRKTATQATFEQNDSTIRREFYVQTVKKFVIQNVERVAVLIQQYFDEEKLVPLYGTTNAKFVKFTKEDIQGDYMFDFDIDSMKFINEAQVQQLINAFNVLGQNPVFQPILGSFDPEMAAKAIFKRMNMNIEEFQPRDHSTKLYFTPQKENDMAVQGMHIPDPKMDEDHKLHLEIHDEVQGNSEMERHKNFHRAMEAQKQPQMQVGVPPAQGTQQGQPQPAAKQGASRSDILSAVAGGKQ